MQFDTIHEYTFHEPRVHWHSGCEDTLVVCQYMDGKHDRIMIDNVSREEIVRFAKEILEDSYNLELKEDVTNQTTPLQHHDSNYVNTSTGNCIQHY